MRAFVFLLFMVWVPQAFSQQFDRIDWIQSAVIDSDAKVVVFNPSFTQIQHVRILEVANIYFTGEGVMGIVAFDCSVPDSSFDLQWGEINDGVVARPVVSPRPSVPFGLTAASRSNLVAPSTWSQVCQNVSAQEFPSNILWDEAVLHVRLHNKLWRKRFDLDKSAFVALEKQYRALPEEQRAVKMQILRDKRVEREELKTFVPDAAQR